MVRVESIMEEYKPAITIVVYRGTDDISGFGKYYLESHNINEDGSLTEGKPLKQETIQEMVDVFFDERKNISNINGIVPENMLSFSLLPGGHHKMVWFRPAETRVLHHAKQLKIPTAKCWVPAMIYAVDRNSLDVYALAKNDRPIENTKLFKAPFFNVNDEGDVCLGNASVKKPKDKTYTNLMKYWEDLFWLSEFSHVNGEKKVKSNDLHSVWNKLIKSKLRKKWSDIDELIPYKSKTLKQVL